MERTEDFTDEGSLGNNLLFSSQIVTFRPPVTKSELKSGNGHLLVTEANQRIAMGHFTVDSLPDSSRLAKSRLFATGSFL